MMITTNSAQPLDEKVHQTLLLVALLALSWGDNAASEPRFVRGAQHGALALGGWLVTADFRQPPDGCDTQFGRYAHCDARRRCVGCELACTTEALLLEQHERSGLDIMSLSAQVSGDGFPRSRMRLFLRQHPYLAGPWRPAIEPGSHVLRLISADGLTVLTPTPDGLDIVARVRPSAADGAAERLFARSLAPGLAVVLDFSRRGQIGPIRAGGVQ
jgi:hypothetical protein